jgi:hypothetical protein
MKRANAFKLEYIFAVPMLDVKILNKFKLVSGHKT